MANLILLPCSNTYISSGKPDLNFMHSNLLYIGTDSSGAVYRALILFDLCSLPQDMVVESAVLRIYAGYSAERSRPGFFSPYIITTSWDEESVNWQNQPCTNLSVSGKPVEISSYGWYSMDITSIVQLWILGDGNNNGLMIKSSEDKRLDIKSFHSFKSYYYRNYRPHMEIKFNYKNSFAMSGRGTSNVLESYRTGNTLSFSSWQDTSNYSMYTFFIQNHGNNAASVMVQISPDRAAACDEIEIYNIAPGTVEAVVPQKFGFYTRLAFKSFFYERPTDIKIWFQAQV